MPDRLCASEEFFVQTADGQLRYRKVNIYSSGSDFIRLNSDRLGAYTDLSKYPQSKSFRVETVYDCSLDDYERQFVQPVLAWEKQRQWHIASPTNGQIKELSSFFFDVFFFWRSLAGHALSKKVVDSGILVWNVAKGSFSGPVGTLVEAGLEAALEPLVKGALRIANIRSGWILDLTKGVATNWASEKVMESILRAGYGKPPGGGYYFPVPPEAVYRLNAAIAFREFIERKAMSAAFSQCMNKKPPYPDYPAPATADNTKKSAGRATTVPDLKLPNTLKF